MKGKGKKGSHQKVKVTGKGGRPRKEQGPLVPPEVRARREAIAGAAWMSDAAARPLVALAGAKKISEAERRAGEELAALWVAYRRAIGGPADGRRGAPGCGPEDDSHEARVMARMAGVEARLSRCPASVLARAIVWSVCVDEDWPLECRRWQFVTPAAWRALHDGLAAVGEALGVPTRAAA